MPDNHFGTYAPDGAADAPPRRTAPGPLPEAPAPGKGVPSGKGASGRGAAAGCMAGCLFGAACMFLLLVVVPAAVVCMAVGKAPAGLLDRAAARGDALYGEDERPAFEEVWSYGTSCDEADAKVVRIPLSGAIMTDDDPWRCRPGSASEALAAIRCATLDESADGVILEIDSPGGEVTASDVLWNAIKEFKAASTNRVVLVHMGDLCASGGYYVSAAADEIMALPTTMTGSIGVVMSSLNIRRLAEKLGVVDVTIASGENKSMLNPFHDLTPAQQAILQKMIDSMHSRFVGIVADGRGLPREKVEKLADGRVFLASEAKELGLIDGVGYFEDAYERMNELLGAEGSYVVRYRREESLRDFFRRSRLLGMAGALRRAWEAFPAKLLYMAGR